MSPIGKRLNPDIRFMNIVSDDDAIGRIARKVGVSKKYIKDRANGSVVYFIQAGNSDGPIKIGICKSDKVLNRLNGLQVGNPYPLVVLGVVPGNSILERKLHDKFQDSRLVGEWFDVSYKLEEFLLECILRREDWDFLRKRPV